MHDTREEGNGRGRRIGRGKQGVESNINKRLGRRRARGRNGGRKRENFLATNEEVLSRCIVRSFQ